MKENEIWLFGSYSKLVFNEKSDVDIAFLISDKIDKEKIRKYLRKIEKHYEKTIEEHFFEKKVFYKNKKDLLVKEIIQHGIRFF